jgi:hypothetical protein
VTRAAPSLPALVFLLMLALSSCGGGEASENRGSSKPAAVYPGRALWLDRLTWKGGKPAKEGPTEARQRVPAPL